MTQTFRFVRPPFLTLPAIAVLAAAPVGFLVPWFRDVLAGAPPWPGLLFFSVAYGALAAAVCGVRVLVRLKQGAVIELHDEHAVLPLSSRSRRSRTVRYDELTSLNVFGKGWLARMLIATPKRNFVYMVSHLERREHAAGELRDALRAKIAALPQGAERLREIDERDTRGTNVTKKPQPASLAILAILVAAYVWTWLGGALDTPFGLAAYGANVPDLVRDGEWYRLFSANFLHANLLHLYLNGLGILILGALLERLIGSWRFVAIYLVSALTGAAASAYASMAVLSVGASTAVFGLLGAFGYVNWRFRDALPGGFSQPLRWWVIILGINAVLPILVPVIDWAAHIGGFAGGIVVARLVCRDARAIEPGDRVGMQLKAATAALSVVFAVALSQAVAGVDAADGSGDLHLMREFVAQDGVRPGALNSLAWDYATRPDVSEAELALAEAAAAKAVDAAPDNDSIIDTLATVYYRQGDFDRAVTTQLRAVALDERRVLLSQMGRFLDARLAESGPIRRGGAGDATVRVAVDRSQSAEPDETWAIVVELARDVEDGIEVFALDKPGNRLIGTLRILMGPGVEAGTHRFAPDRGLLGTQWPRAAEPVVAYVDASGCACEPGEIRARYFTMHRDIRELP